MSDLDGRFLTARTTFAANLKNRRVAMGLSQGAVAQLAMLDRTYIGSVERGERNISIDNMERIANAVGLEVLDLLQPIK